MTSGPFTVTSVILKTERDQPMKSLSVTETFEKLMALEAASLTRIEALQADVRRVREELEAEIEATNRLLGECEEM
ncbi:MAG: hypothetical protein ACO253_08030 [Burkholderiaceae bacterium]